MLAEDVSPPLTEMLSEECVHTGCVGGSRVQRRAALRGLALRNAKTEQKSGTEARRPLGLCVKLEMNRKVFQQNTETGL